MSRVALVVLAVALGLLAPARSSADDPSPNQKVVADVLAKLKEKQNRGWNERYKLERDRPTGLDKLDFQVDWKTGLFRYGGVVTSENPHEGVEVYDGKQLKTHFRLLNADKTPKGDWRYGLITGDMNDRVFVADYWPMFFNRGGLKVSSKDAFYPGHFTFDLPDPTAFFLHNQVGAGGKGLVTLRTFPENPVRKPFYEYTFDLSKDCAVTEFRFWLEGETVTHLAIELKQYGTHWAPSGWVLTRDPNKKDKTVTKVRVTSFAADVPVTEENAYDVVPPEGAKVGRSDYQPTTKPSAPKVEYYEYEVKNGKLEQISGPIAGFWQQLGNGRWGIAATVFFGAVVLFLRRLSFRRKV